MTDTTDKPLAGKKILVVDDEKFTVVPATSLLEAKGAKVTFKNSLEKGLVALKKGTFDLVVLDLRFTNGIPKELKKHLRQPDEDKAFQRYGTALGAWLEKNRSETPVVYYTILPDRIDDDSGVAVDKLKEGPMALLDKIRESLQIQ